MENIYSVAIPEPKTEGKVLTVKDGQWQLGDSIPASTTTDSGKVLTVGSDGKPEWAEGGGTTNILMLTMATKPDAEGTLILNKTYAEINAVWSNNGLVVLNDTVNYVMYFVVSCLARGANEYAVSFTGVDSSAYVTSLEFLCESESDYPEAAD